MKLFCLIRTVRIHITYCSKFTVLHGRNISRVVIQALRTVPSIITAHIFCVCQGSLTRRERNGQHAGHADWFCLLLVWGVLVTSCGKDASFLNRWKIIFIYFVSSLKTEEVCACCYFCRMIDLTEHFIVKQKSILKHQKLLLQDVTPRAWVLKNPLIGKDQ